MVGDMTVIMLSAAVFLALILYIALEQEQREKVTGATFFLAAIGGIIIYGFIYSHGRKGVFEHMSAILKTLVDVGRMFVGSNNETLFLQVLEQNGANKGAWSFLFWCSHFLAYYSMASAAILALGKGAVRNLQIILLGIRNVELVYGVNDNTLAYGRNRVKEKKWSLVFVGMADPMQEQEIRQMGGILFADDGAINPGKPFLKKLKLRGRSCKLHLCALSEQEDDNFNYALHMLKLMEDAGISPKNTSLVLLGREERQGVTLQASRDHYGYGEVKSFDMAELTARLLMQKYPVCDYVSFDENGLAKNDVEVLIVGFGRMGQEILKKTIVNGQFEGGHYHADIFDPDFHNIDGFFRMRYAAMLEEYDIEFHSDGGRSREFCDYLREHAHKLTYVVIAVGEKNHGREIADNITDLFLREGVNLPVYQCWGGSVVCYRTREESEYASLHDADILYGGDMDDMAIRLNHYYNDPDGDKREQWLACDYFSRMSCRASVDFLCSYIRRIRSEYGPEISKGKLENMAKTEHLRWNAFHYTMEYSCMSRETWEERAEEYRRQERMGAVKKIRITKDVANRQHACLVTWDELDELSERENAVTGKQIDYKQMDRDNVNVILKLMAEAGA